jgi:hypothetical protein
MRFRLLVGCTDAAVDAVREAITPLTGGNDVLLAAVNLVEGHLEEFRCEGDPHAFLCNVCGASFGTHSIRDDKPGVVAWMVEAKDVPDVHAKLGSALGDETVLASLGIDDTERDTWSRTTREFGPDDVEKLPQAAGIYAQLMMASLDDALATKRALLVIGDTLVSG